ncbi:uncharacterized protein [Narcine bancroftii]|uniref:uncharacterized protein isoform X3 n=1 Tax=Narcine bancroftii TaxID=1343680 RepID=UPI0038310A42
MHYDSIELESKCQVDDEELHEKVSELAGLKKKSRETDEHLLRKVKDIESLKNDLLITGNEIMEKDLEIEKLRKSQKRPGPFGSRQGNLVSQPRARDHATRESTEGDQEWKKIINFKGRTWKLWRRCRGYFPGCCLHWKINLLRQIQQSWDLYLWSKAG